jgi:hypothetical protein
LFEALLESVAFTCAQPVAVGEKDTLTATLCPAASVNGKLTLDRLNSAPVQLIADTQWYWSAAVCQGYNLSLALPDNNVAVAQSARRAGQLLRGGTCESRKQRNQQRDADDEKDTGR